MNFKLRGTNVIALELLTNKENFNLENIKKFIAERKQILKGTRLVVCVEDYLLSLEDVRKLVDSLKGEADFVFCGFRTNVKENKELCSRLGIPCEITNFELEKKNERATNEEVKFYRKTLRSGDRVTSSGDLIVMGDVNPGAEVEAGGNVYVMGNLMGFVKAGIGKSEGEVRALYFRAPILEICGKTISFDRQEAYINFKIKVKNGKLIVEHGLKEKEWQIR